MTNLDFPDWSEARSFAEEISQFGAPLLRLTANLGKSALGLTIPSNTVSDLFPLTNIDQPGYEIVVGLDSSPASLSNPFALLTVNWIDSVSGIQIAGDEFTVGAGNSNPSGLFYYLSGPCKADQINMTVENMDPSGSMVCRYTANVNSHIYAWDRIFQTQYVGTPPHGYQNTGGTPQFGIIALRKPIIPPSGVDTSLLSLYNGKCALHVDNTFGAGSLLVSLQDPAQLYGSAAGASVFVFNVASGATLETTCSLPNAPVELALINGSSTNALTPTVSLIRQDY